MTVKVVGDEGKDKTEKKLSNLESFSIMEGVWLTGWVIPSIIYSASPLKFFHSVIFIGKLQFYTYELA